MLPRSSEDLLISGAVKSVYGVVKGEQMMEEWRKYEEEKGLAWSQKGNSKHSPPSLTQARFVARKAWQCQLYCDTLER